MRTWSRFFGFFLTFSFIVFCASNVFPQYTDNWKRVGDDRLPSDAVYGGNETGGVQTLVCRARNDGRWIAGRAFGGRCYFADGRNERSTTDFQILTGPDGEFIWKSLTESDKAVSAGDDSYVCRVAVGGGVYPGELKDGRCRYAVSGRGTSSGRYELLEGRKPRFDILLASERGDLDAVRAAIRSGQSVDLRGPNGMTPLMIAAEKGHLSIVSELLRRNAAINAADDEGNTALIFAAGEDNEGVVRSLLRENAFAGIANRDGYTALSIAASKGHEKVLRVLFGDKSFPGINSEESQAAFRAAAANGKEDALELFLDYGVNIDSSDPITGRTALMEASAGRHTDAIKFLLRNTANINIADRKGYTAFQFAVLADSDKTLKVFVEETRRVRPADGEAEEGLRNAARLDKKESLEYLIKQGVDLDAFDERNGYTALMWAAGEGHEGATEKLIRAGADLNARNVNGETALMLAAANSKTNTLKELIKARADLNLTDGNGRTALDWAIANGHGDTRKELEKAGAAVSKPLP